ncbi:hypothetical protein D5R81_18385 [Parashewanella spongiae]|uniref:Uncharacterized protein n=1 Tax=Parashewanella spongiae TaxID=342950 RepID=A0A3A6TEI2_9GAMM|nr:hypothetical protein [Parashewanella spongiae]MCL1080016.1 hypothetical protein [Parashewanella spongiae]RJY05854.1 hypothetical protein D5R81_18385 [Parashewanella spongiae]
MSVMVASTSEHLNILFWDSTNKSFGEHTKNIKYARPHNESNKYLYFDCVDSNSGKHWLFTFELLCKNKVSFLKETYFTSPCDSAREPYNAYMQLWNNRQLTLAAKNGKKFVSGFNPSKKPTDILKQIKESSTFKDAPLPRDLHVSGMNLVQESEKNADDNEFGIINTTESESLLPQAANHTTPITKIVTDKVTDNTIPLATHDDIDNLTRKLSTQVEEHGFNVEVGDKVHSKKLLLFLKTEQKRVTSSRKGVVLKPVYITHRGHFDSNHSVLAVISPEQTTIIEPKRFYWYRKVPTIRMGFQPIFNTTICVHSSAYTLSKLVNRFKTDAQCYKTKALLNQTIREIKENERPTKDTLTHFFD